jgi:hypothetical protein
LATTRSTLYSGGSVHPYAMLRHLVCFRWRCCRFSLAIPCCLYGQLSLHQCWNGRPNKIKYSPLVMRCVRT